MSLGSRHRSRLFWCRPEGSCTVCGQFTKKNEIDRQNSGITLSLLLNLRQGNVLNERLSDNVLQAALVRDDPAAVELMWDRYANDLLAFLKCVLCSIHDAEDVLQMVFVRIVRKRNKLAKARCLDAYVYRIARNEASGWIRRRSRERRERVADDPWLVVRESHNEPSDLAERLQAALARLPQAQREVIVMKIYRHKTFLQIARLLDLSQSTVASRYRYGTEKLRVLLENIAL